MLAACWPMHLAVTGLNNAKPVKAVRRSFTRFESVFGVPQGLCISVLRVFSSSLIPMIK